MARSRIKGKNISFLFDTEEYKCDLTSAVLSKDDADAATSDSIITFCDAEGSAGGQVWFLDIEAIQSCDVDGVPEADDVESLHTLVWNAAATNGGMVVPFNFAPYGNTTPTAAQPFFTGSVTIEQGAYPSLGGSAGDNSFTWSYRFTVTDNIVNRVSSPGQPDNG